MKLILGVLIGAALTASASYGTDGFSEGFDVDVRQLGANSADASPTRTPRPRPTPDRTAAAERKNEDLREIATINARNDAERTAIVATARAGPVCDPSYPSLCLELGSRDLDCGDVSARRFEVLPPDPHGFDADFDGVGCESG